VLILIIDLEILEIYLYDNNHSNNIKCLEWRHKINEREKGLLDP